MTSLSVNVNKIALLRNSRGADSPSVLKFSKLAIDAGCQGITVHPRPDLRHITPSDVKGLHALCEGLDHIEFNIEGNPFSQPNDHYPGLLSLIELYRPDQATLVPDTEQQLTSDHGFDLITQDTSALERIIDTLKQWEVRVSLFMSPDVRQIRQAAKIGADRIELYTGPYASKPNEPSLLADYKEAIIVARNYGLGVNAGHDLDLNNLQGLLNLGKIDEVSIGHALTIDALLNGYQHTVKQYVSICQLNT